MKKSMNISRALYYLSFICDISCWTLRLFCCGIVISLLFRCQRLDTSEACSRRRSGNALIGRELEKKMERRAEAVAYDVGVWQNQRQKSRSDSHCGLWSLVATSQTNMRFYNIFYEFVRKRYFFEITCVCEFSSIENVGVGVLCVSEPFRGHQ